MYFNLTPSQNSPHGWHIDVNSRHSLAEAAGYLKERAINSTKKPDMSLDTRGPWRVQASARMNLSLTTHEPDAVVQSLFLQHHKARTFIALHQQHQAAIEVRLREYSQFLRISAGYYHLREIDGLQRSHLYQKHLACQSVATVLRTGSSDWPAFRAHLNPSRRDQSN